MLLNLDNIILNFRLPVMTDYVMNYILPDIDELKNPPVNNFDNPIKLKVITIFGSPGVGKTTVMRAITEEIIRKYGKESVNAVMNENIEDMLLYGLDDRLIQVQCIDDYTLVKEDEFILKKLFEIRNIWKEKYKVTNGLIFVMIGAHRYHSTIKEIRSIADVNIIKSNSIDKYDKSVIKSIIGNNGLEDLIFIEEYKTKFSELKNFSAFETKTEQVGLIRFPLINTNSFISSKNIRKSLSNIEQLYRKRSILMDGK